MESELLYPRPARDVQDIILDLELLCQEKGFIYTFSFMVFSSLCMSPEELGDINWFERLNHQELSFLLALMVNYRLSLDFPSSPEMVFTQESRAHALLEELHKVHTFGNISVGDVDTSDPILRMEAIARNYEEWVGTGRGMIEPIFYSGEGACIFQHLEMADKRYKSDSEWIENHIGTSLISVIEIASELERLFNGRDPNNEPPTSFQEQCRYFLERFCFKAEDISEAEPKAVRNFLKTFVILPGEEPTHLNAIGKYNRVRSHPVLQLENGEYFAPILSNLAYSIYESPYYWMMQDHEYKVTAEKNRGDATEQIAYDLLKQVFGEKFVFRGAKVKKEGRDVTDIDVLATKGRYMRAALRK